MLMPGFSLQEQYVCHVNPGTSSLLDLWITDFAFLANSRTTIKNGRISLGTQWQYGRQRIYWQQSKSYFGRVQYTGLGPCTACYAARELTWNKYLSSARSNLVLLYAHAFFAVVKEARRLTIIFAWPGCRNSEFVIALVTRIVVTTFSDFIHSLPLRPIAISYFTVAPSSESTGAVGFPSSFLAKPVEHSTLYPSFNGP